MAATPSLEVAINESTSTGYRGRLLLLFRLGIEYSNKCFRIE